jgi:hemerythrin-like metal-binding protein
MALLTWSEEQSIGVSALDEEHRALFGAINTLDAAMVNNQDRGLIEPLLRKVAASTCALFSSEETMMTQANYPGLGLHRIKHQYLLEQLVAFANRFERGGAMLNQHSLNFLRDWCNTHIEKEDKQFGQWLSEHGKW